MKKLDTIVDGITVEVEVDNSSVIIEGSTVNITPIESHTYHTETRTTQFLVDDIISLEDSTSRIEIAGYTIDVRVIDPIDLAFTGDDQQQGEITAPMSGQISKILVGISDLVKKGGTLLVISAMKMENQISSPVDGVVKQIYISEGDQIESGKILLEIELK
ncbi:MAG: biotin/lipoyl-containing protein [Candidatus Kariarchaeaceae archaeon]